MRRTVLQFRVSEEAYERFKRRKEGERAGPSHLGNRLGEALTKFLDELEETNEYLRRRPVGPIRRAKLSVDVAIAERLDAVAKTHRVPREELIRHAIGRFVDWY